MRSRRTVRLLGAPVLRVGCQRRCARAPLYAGSNGGAYWDGALVIRRSVEVAGAPLDVLAWNAEGC